MMQLHRVSTEQGDAAGLKHWQDLKRRWLEYERTGFPPNATRICRWHTESKGGIWPLPRPSAWQVFRPHCGRQK